MKVKRAKTAGFCFGVHKALVSLDKQLARHQQKNQSQDKKLSQDKNQKSDVKQSSYPNKKQLGEVLRGKDQQAQPLASGGRLITLGPIIHNPLVMEHYTAQGVLCLNDVRDIRKDDSVIIRAHGITKEVEEALHSIGAKVVDATCPKVKKAQLAIANEAAKGATLLLLGEPDHPEVQGLISYAEQRALVFSGVEELAAIPLDATGEYFFAAQTTQEKDVFHAVGSYLNEVLQKPFVTLHTICNATRNRQDEVIALSDEVEAMVVVGGYNSGNTKRLAQVAAARGIPAFHVEKVEDLPVEKLRGLSVVGLTAGASTPDSHVDAMEQFLLTLGRI